MTTNERWITIADPAGEIYELHWFDPENDWAGVLSDAGLVHNARAVWCSLCETVITEGYANHYGASGWFVLCQGCATNAEVEA